MTGSGELVCVLEDHRFLGQLVAIELESFGFQAELFEPDDAIVSAIVGLKPALVLLDVELGPALDSLRACRELVRAGIEVVLFTGVEDTILLASYLEIGAKGILSKTEDLESLATQVRQAVRGGAVAPGATERIAMLSALDRHRSSRAQALEPFETLSQSEAEVLGEIVNGLTVGEIANARFVSVTTIRAQVRAIHSKLGVNTQLGAVSLATRVGWSLPVPDSP